MILYEVNAEIHESFAQEYLDWLGPHIKAILKEPGFLSAQVFEQKEESVHLVKCFTVHYYLRSLADFENYVRGPAKKFREEALAKFGERLTVHRRVLESDQKYLFKTERA